MTMTSPPTSCSFATCSAYDVLCDAFLMRSIASFQCGFPRDIVDWKRANESILSPWGLSQRPKGLLPNLAVQTNNLPMLERLYRYHKEQPAQYDGNTKMSFAHVWAMVLKCGYIEMAEWIEVRDLILWSHCDSEQQDTATIRHAIGSPGVEMTQWLVKRRPQYKQMGRLFTMYEVATTGNVELCQWLVDNVQDLTTSPRQMDVAAKGGHLDMVRYLHEHGTGCTSRAMDDAARFGHLAVVTFLHEHRTEGCTTNAMDAAARKGDLEMVRFLHENRTEGATLQAMTGAVLNRHVEMVHFLQQNRTEGCDEMAIEYAAKQHDLAMVRFLHDHYPAHSMERALYAATNRGHLDIVQYIVENTTQGCVFYCLTIARQAGLVEIEAYLSAIVGPLTQNCTDTVHKKEDTKRVCQK